MAITDLHWTPDTFWQATPHELYAAMEVAYSRTEDGQKREREAEFAKFRTKLETAGVA